MSIMWNHIIILYTVLAVAKKKKEFKPIFDLTFIFFILLFATK